MSYANVPRRSAVQGINALHARCESPERPVHIGSDMIHHFGCNSQRRPSCHAPLGNVSATIGQE